MIIYRPHRGGIAEAIAEAKEFENIEDMKKYITDSLSRNTPDGYKPFEISDIVILDESHNDDRIGWRDVHHVCIKRLGNEDYMKEYGCPQCIGMCSEDYDKNYMEVFEEWCKQQVGT